MVQTFLNGIVQGLLFAVLGVAFSLVYATTRVFHIALGATFALAPYVALWCLSVDLPWWLGVAIAVLVSAGIGLLIEATIHWPLERSRASSESHFISSLGAFLAVGQIVTLTWGSDARMFRFGMDAVVQLGPLRLTQSQAMGAILAALLLTGFFAGLRWSDLGLRFRALADDSSLLATIGADVRRLRFVAFAASGALAALVSLTMARDVGFDPNVGMGAVLIGVTATIVGGRSSFAGAAVAGLLVGVARAQVVWHSSARWEDAATLAFLVLFLLIAPGGLAALVRGKRRPEDGS